MFSDYACILIASYIENSVALEVRLQLPITRILMRVYSAVLIIDCNSSHPSCHDATSDSSDKGCGKIVWTADNSIASCIKYYSEMGSPP